MSLRFLTAGESHGPALTTILEGLPSGLPLTAETINIDLRQRQHGYGAGGRMKIESDQAAILSGVLEGKTSGAPLTMLIENADHSRWKNKEIPPMTIPRPGHADFAGALKYGYNDLRPALERASARETAARVAVGAVCRALLTQFGIRVGGYVRSIGQVQANLKNLSYAERIERALTDEVHCPDPEASGQMQQAIHDVMYAKNTLGGVIEIAALGLPPGLGSFMQWDRRLDARIAAAVLSVNAMKGMEFGPAFENTTLPGTQVHDPFRLQDGTIARGSENDGGLEAGMTTGQPLIVRAAMKPIPTTLTPQQSVDLKEGKETDTQYERSDFCPVPRAVVILEAMIAFVLAQALLETLGGDSLPVLLERFAVLPKGKLDDFHLDGHGHIFWD